MKIGLLPLYLALYDKTSKKTRDHLEPFYDELVAMFEERGVTVERSPFCRLNAEFKESVANFEAAKVDAIVTIHMAYSPSLECIEALAGTELPIVVLDTTPLADFSPEQTPAGIMLCHGIHGVMDMCSMLKRYGKAYAIAAGYYKDGDCVDRVCGYVRAAVAAAALKKANVGLLCGSFEGMGDFAVPRGEMKARFGINVTDIDSASLTACRENLSAEAIEAELAADKEAFIFSDGVVEDEYKEVIKDCLAMRAWLEANGATAFSANFSKLTPACGIGTTPFIEGCKGMARGIGYAGEGDVLTAAFTGAFLAGYPETGFVEPFCPDWEHDTVFMSHMAEVNYLTVNGKPTLYPRGAAGEEHRAYGAYACMKGGKGVYINISRDKDDYQILAAEAEMLDVEKDNFPTSMRGWMKPAKGSLASFLEDLSENGATHHSCFIYGATAKEMKFFAKLLKMKFVEI